MAYLLSTGCGGFRIFEGKSGAQHGWIKSSRSNVQTQRAASPKQSSAEPRGTEMGVKEQGWTSGSGWSGQCTEWTPRVQGSQGVPPSPHQR